VRFLELMPIGCAAPIFRDSFVPVSEVRTRLEESFGLKALAYGTGQTSRNFLAVDRKGRRGTIGLISPQTQPFCNGCTRVRLTSTGRLISCLARGEGPSVRELVRSDSPGADRALGDLVAAELGHKAERSGFDSVVPMAIVGG
jgi:cyclic pyranopterin phosphate synthase